MKNLLKKPTILLTLVQCGPEELPRELLGVPSCPGNLAERHLEPRGGLVGPAQLPLPCADYSLFWVARTGNRQP